MGKRTGVGKNQTCHYLRMTGSNNLRHNAAKGLTHQPDFLSKVMQKFSHRLRKRLVVGSADGIVEGKDRELLGQAIKMKIKQIGTNPVLQSAKQWSPLPVGSCSSGRERIFRWATPVCLSGIFGEIPLYSWLIPPFLQFELYHLHHTPTIRNRHADLCEKLQTVFADMAIVRFLDKNLGPTADSPGQFRR